MEIVFNKIEVSEDFFETNLKLRRKDMFVVEPKKKYTKNEIYKLQNILLHYPTFHKLSWKDSIKVIERVRDLDYSKLMLEDFAKHKDYKLIYGSPS